VDSRPQALRPAETTCLGPLAGKPSTQRFGKRGGAGAAEPVEEPFLVRRSSRSRGGGWTAPEHQSELLGHEMALCGDSGSTVFPSARKGRAVSVRLVRRKQEEDYEHLLHHRSRRGRTVCPWILRAPLSGARQMAPSLALCPLRDRCLTSESADAGRSLGVSGQIAVMMIVLSGTYPRSRNPSRKRFELLPLSHAA
jgi:hypothetical protein